MRTPFAVSYPWESTSHVTSPPDPSASRNRGGPGRPSAAARLPALEEARTRVPYAAARPELVPTDTVLVAVDDLGPLAADSAAARVPRG